MYNDLILLLVKYLLLKFKRELNKIIFNMSESERIEIIDLSDNNLVNIQFLVQFF